MAGPITWRNIAAPDSGAAMAGTESAGRFLQQAGQNFQNMGNIFESREEASRLEMEAAQQEEKDQFLFDIQRTIDSGESVDVSALTDVLNTDEQRQVYQYQRDADTRAIQDRIQQTTLELGESELNQRRALHNHSNEIAQTIVGFQNGEIDDVEVRETFDRLLSDGVPANFLLEQFSPVFRSAQEQRVAIEKANTVAPLADTLNKISNGVMSFTSGLNTYDEMYRNNPEFRMMAQMDPENWGREAFVRKMKQNEEMYQDLGVTGQQVLDESEQRLEGVFNQELSALRAEEEEIKVDTNFGNSEIAFNYMDQITNSASLEQEVRRVIREAGGSQDAAGEVIRIISEEANNLHPAAMAAIASSVIGENATRGAIARFFTGKSLTNEGRLAVRQAVNRHAADYANLRENYAAYSQRMLDLNQRRAAVESSRESAINALRDNVRATRDNLRESGEAFSAREERELLLRASDSFINESLPSLLRPTREIDRDETEFNNEARRLLQTNEITPEALSNLAQERDRLNPDNIRLFNEIIEKSDLPDLGEDSPTINNENLTTSFSDYVRSRFNDSAGIRNEQVSLNRDEMSAIGHAAATVAGFFSSRLGRVLGREQAVGNFITNISEYILESPNALKDQELEFSRWLADNRPDLVDPEKEPKQAHIDRAWLDFRGQNKILTNR